MWDFLPVSTQKSDQNSVRTVVSPYTGIPLDLKKDDYFHFVKYVPKDGDYLEYRLIKASGDSLSHSN